VRKKPKTHSKKKRSSSKRAKLLEHVIQLTGLPSQVLPREIQSILDKKNIRPEEMNLEQLRLVATSYLRDIMGSLLDKNSASDKSNELH